MSYKPLTQDLQSKWSEKLPKVIWRNFDLTPNQSSVNQSMTQIDLSHLSFGEALKATQVELEYVEFLKLSIDLDQAQLSSLEEHFHFRLSDEAKSLREKLLKLPESFFNWAKEKKLKYNDLRPLNRLELNQRTLTMLGALSLTRASKQQGTDLLEHICDLTEEQVKILSPLTDERDPESWLSALKKIRAPKVTSKDTLRDEKVKLWPWPSRMQGRWKRRGDQAGLEIEIYSTNPSDLGLKIDQLKDFKARWENEL